MNFFTNVIFKKILIYIWNGEIYEIGDAKVKLIN